MRLLLSTIAVAGVLLAGPAVAAENLNTNSKEFASLCGS